MREQQLKTQKKAIITGAIITVMLVVALIAFISTGSAGKIDFIDVSYLDTVDEIRSANANTLYKFDEMTIVDRYASKGGASSEEASTVYYLVMFTDKNSYPYFASLEIDTKESIYKYIEDNYIKNDSAVVGDMVIPVCASATGEHDKNLDSYRSQAVDVYKGHFTNQVYEIEDTMSWYKYACDTPENVDDYIKSQKSSAGSMYTMMAMVAVVILIFTLKSVKKYKKLKAMSDEEFITQVQTSSPAAETITDTQTGEYYNPEESTFLNNNNND